MPVSLGGAAAFITRYIVVECLTVKDEPTIANENLVLLSASKHSLNNIYSPTVKSPKFRDRTNCCRLTFYHGNY